MARITQPTGTMVDLSQLRDYDPYVFRLKAIDWQQSDPKFSKNGETEMRMIVDWELVEDPDLSIRDWISLRLGRQQNGQVSKLRMLLNAIAQQPESTDIAWFDDETLEWSYDDKHIACKLGEGLEVAIRGKVVEKIADNGEKKRRYNVTTYQMVVEQKPPATGAVRGRPATQVKEDLQQRADQARQASTRDDDNVPF